MENNQLYHHGVKGMRWGVRKDRRSSSGGKKKGSSDKDQQPESKEARRARMMKSSDAKELYKNRDVLSNEDIVDRINRINMEKALLTVANQDKKTFSQRVQDVLTIGNSLNDVYKFMQTPMMTALANKITGKEDDDGDDGVLSMEKLWKRHKTLSADEMKELWQRYDYENKIQKMINKDADNTGKGKKTGDDDDDNTSGGKGKKSKNTGDDDDNTSGGKGKNNKGQKLGDDDDNTSGGKGKKSKNTGDDDPGYYDADFDDSPSSSRVARRPVTDLVVRPKKESRTYWDTEYDDISDTSSGGNRTTVAGLIGSGAAAVSRLLGGGGSSVSGLLSGGSSSRASLPSTPVAGLLGSGSRNNTTLSIGKSAIAGLLAPPEDD